jgi:signal transduction histidine kinase
MISNLRSEAAGIKQLEPEPRGENVPHTPRPSMGIPMNTLLEIMPGAPNTEVNSSPLSTERVMGLVEMAVAEKRLQARGGSYDIAFEASVGAYSAFARVQRTELKAALLNLMNNAVESLSGAGRQSGRVDIGVSATEDSVRITVNDDGPGIDPAVLPRLGERGFSIGKNGSGLGLHHA